MLVINEKDKVSKRTKDYFVNNGLNKNDPKNNPEEYIVRISKLKMDCVMALYDKDKIMVAEAVGFPDNKETYDILVFWYDKEIKEIGDAPVYLTYTYGATNFLNERSAVQYYADDIYNALVKNKIIFEVDYDRY